MNGKGDDITGGNAGELLRRRKLLATLGAAGVSGFAGCSENIPGGDNESDGGDGATGDLACTDVTNGYDSQDVSGRPFIFTFEYPTLFGELEFVQAPPLVLLNGSRSNGDISIDIEIQQVTDPEESIGEVTEGTGGITTTFNGEEVEFFGVSSGSDLVWAADLPYQLDGQRETFATVISLSFSEEGSNACGDALREAAEHIVSSMEVNSETSLGVDGGGTDGDGESDGDDGTTGDQGCMAVTNGYERLDVGPRQVIFDFEYPALFDELEFIQAPTIVLYSDSQSSGDVTIDIEVQQVTDPAESIGAAPEGSGGTTTTFNGEEVEFFGISSGSEVFWAGDLPYQLDGQRETFATVVSLSSSGEGSNACGDALREAAEHLVSSMELNSETTIGN
jgi:hypothetical protein